MCRPEHFGVLYAINPWMDPSEWERDERTLAAASHSQWMALRKTLRDLGARIELVPPVPGVPDLVFTANAAVVMDRKALLARFRHPQRRAEENHHWSPPSTASRARGILDDIVTLPDDVTLEGAGDCVFDRTRNLFWIRDTVHARMPPRRRLSEDIGLDLEASRTEFVIRASITWIRR